MKKRQLNATTLRLILAISLFGIAGIGTTVFSIADKMLKASATEASHAVADASASRNNLQNLQKLQQDLVTKKEVVSRAASIVAESQSYEYQNQIINDLNDYASRAGLSIISINFDTAGAAAGGNAATPTAPTTVVNGVKSTSASIALRNPVDYASILRFIKSIEQNLTKMQISSIGLSQGTDDKKGITSDTLNIEVYIK
jgi:hypothetical protein